MLRAALSLTCLLLGGIGPGQAARKVVKRHTHDAHPVVAEEATVAAVQAEAAEIPPAAPQKNASGPPTALLHQATRLLHTGVLRALERGRDSSSRWMTAVLKRQQVVSKWTASLTWNQIVALLLGCGIFVVGLACGVMTTVFYFRLYLGGHAGDRYKSTGASGRRPKHMPAPQTDMGTSSNDRFLANDLMDMTVVGSTADVPLRSNLRVGMTSSAR